MHGNAEYYDVSEVCTLTGLRETAVRFYESLYREVLPEKVLRGDKAYYTHEGVQLLCWIDELKKQGVSIPADVLAHLRKNRRGQAEPEQTYGQVIVVTSGKGGVGKSNIALNLSIALEKSGVHTLLIDCDLGLANLHILCGHNAIHNIHQVTHRNKSLSEVVEPGPGGIDLITGGSGMADLANLPRHARVRLASELEKVERDYGAVILDTAPGITRAVTDFAQAADLVVLVTTPELTSTTDAYGMLKTIVRSSAQPEVGILCNMSRTKAQAEAVFARLEVCSRRFLASSIRDLGYIPRDPIVAKANQTQKPYILQDPTARASKHTKLLADKVRRIPRTRFGKHRSSLNTFLKVGDSARGEQSEQRVEVASP